MLNVKQESCEYQLLKSFSHTLHHWGSQKFWLGRRRQNGKILWRFW